MKSNHSLFSEPFEEDLPTQKKEISIIPINQKDFLKLPIEEFEELTSLRYLHHLEFPSEEVYQSVKKLSAKAVEKDLERRYQWRGIHYHKELKNGFVNDVTIKWVDDRLGFGLFANKRILPGEFIGEYVGTVRPITYWFSNVNEYCFRYPLYHIGYTIYTIDAEDTANETSFINHSNRPNSESVVTYNNKLLHICIVASQEIEPGEQITYDYGNNRWKNPYS